MTCRRDCRVQWFIDSLRNQFDPTQDDIEVIIVDFYQSERLISKVDDGTFSIRHVSPKPTVWQGPHKLTKEDWFAPSNARNTALCLCRTPWIAYVDDLSVLIPGWLQSVREAMEKDYIVFGAYKKVKDLVVDGGVVQSFAEFPPGVDSRWNSGSDTGPVNAAGSWLFGCSLAIPTYDLLAIGGWPELLCDSLGSEDYITGIVLQNAGRRFKYDRRMLTLESEELHHAEPSFKRRDKGVSPNDKSHAVLALAKTLRRFDNHFPGGLNRMRESILDGEPFPVTNQPSVDWFDGQAIAEM